MYDIIQKINSKSYANIEDLLNVIKEVPFLFGISEKQKEMLRIVIAAIKEEYGERFDIKIHVHTNRWQRCVVKIELIIRYDIITITSTDGLQHTTKELFVIHPLSFSDKDRLMTSDRIRVFSTHFTLAELHNRYVHSHIPDHFVNNFIFQVQCDKKEKFDIYTDGDELCLGSSDITQAISQLYDQDVTDFMYYFSYVDRFIANENKSGVFNGKKLEQLKAVIKSASSTNQYRRLEHAPTEITSMVRTWIIENVDALLPLVENIRFTGTRFEVDVESVLEKHILQCIGHSSSTTIYNTIDKCYYQKGNLGATINLSSTRSIIRHYDNKGNIGFYFRNAWIPITLEDDMPKSTEDIQENYITVLRPAVVALIIKRLNKTINQKYYEYRCEKETCI